MSESTWTPFNQRFICVPSNPCLIVFINFPGSKEAFVRFAHGISAANATWYSINDIRSDIPSLSSLLETSEENVHAILASIGVGKYTKGGLFKFSSRVMNDFIHQFGIRDTCELTKYKLTGDTSMKWFVRFGTKNLNKSNKSPGTPGQIEHGQIHVKLTWLQNEIR